MRKLIGWAESFGVSPEDHTRGRGGFNGEYFTVRGVTDRKFSTEAEAEAAILAKRPRWRKVAAPNMSGPVYQAPGGGKFLCVFPCDQRPIWSDADPSESCDGTHPSPACGFDCPKFDGGRDSVSPEAR